MKYFLAVAFLAAASAVPRDIISSQWTPNTDNLAFDQGIDQRIVGGNEVPPHEAPYQAALFIGDSFCGGSLISDKYVLTTAQCAALGDRPVVVLGAHRIKEREKEQYSVVAYKVIIHPHWDKYEHDIALIMLPNSVRFTNAIQPMRLAPVEAGSFINQQVRVTGWGLTSDNDRELSPVLRYILNPIVDNKICESALKVSLGNGQMCLSGESNRVPCLGDGGSPVIAAYNNELVQVGMVSFMDRNSCERGRPVGLTRISFYRKWIDANAI